MAQTVAGMEASLAGMVDSMQSGEVAVVPGRVRSDLKIRSAGAVVSGGRARMQPSDL